MLPCADDGSALSGKARVRLSYCRDRFTSVLVQIAPNGSFPLELARTKPYGYCLFNLDAMGTLFEILASVSDTVWTFETPDGRGIRKAVEYMFPFIADNRRWLLPAAVQYFAEWPVRQPSLLFAGLAFSRPAHVKLWLRLNPQPVTEEIIRNLPIRQPYYGCRRRSRETNVRTEVIPR